MIPSCPRALPDHLTEPLHRFAAAWVESPLRPRVEKEISQAWDRLIDEWIGSNTLPLFIRKSSETRGAVLAHRSGRPLIPCDNTTAVWAFTLAAEGHCPSLLEVGAAIENGDIPVSFTGLRGRFANFYACGWKLAHVEDVGLGTRERLQDVPIAALEGHFRKLVLPSNMFAIPKVWAGLGEVPEVIEAICRSGEYVPISLRSAPSGQEYELVAASRSGKNTSSRPHADSSRTALRGNSYRATRLLFRASVIERLADDQTFRIETPEGTYELTKAEFHTTFANVAESDTYRRTGVYSYSRAPEKARRYLLSGA